MARRAGLLRSRLDERTLLSLGVFELYSSRLDHGGGPRSLCDRGRRPMFVSLPGLAPAGGLDGEAAMRCCKGNYAFYVKINMPRSEEHTSELQSLRHLVCRLL